MAYDPSKFYQTLQQYAPPVETPPAAPTEQPVGERPSLLGTAGRGASQSLLGTVSLIRDAFHGWLQQMAGNEEEAARLYSAYNQIMDDFSKANASGQIPQELENIKSVDDASRYIAYWLGYGVGQIPTMVIGGGGGAVGGAVARNVAARALSRTAAERAAATAAGRSVGAHVGLGASTIVPNIGESAAGVYEAGGTDQEAALLAGAAGVAKGLLDYVPIVRLLGRSGITRETAEALIGQSIFRRMGREIALNAPIEGITEGLQEAIDAAVESAYKEGFWSPETVSRVANSAVAGMIGSVPAGVLAGGVQHYNSTRNQPTPEVTPPAPIEQPPDNNIETPEHARRFLAWRGIRLPYEMEDDKLVALAQKEEEAWRNQVYNRQDADALSQLYADPKRLYTDILNKGVDTTGFKFSDVLEALEIDPDNPSAAGSLRRQFNAAVDEGFFQKAGGKGRDQRFRLGTIDRTAGKDISGTEPGVGTDPSGSMGTQRLLQQEIQELTTKIGSVNPQLNEAGKPTNPEFIQLKDELDNLLLKNPALSELTQEQMTANQLLSILSKPDVEQPKALKSLLDSLETSPDKKRLINLVKQLVSEDAGLRKEQQKVNSNSVEAIELRSRRANLRNRLEGLVEGKIGWEKNPTTGEQELSPSSAIGRNEPNTLAVEASFQQAAWLKYLDAITEKTQADKAKNLQDYKERLAQKNSRALALYFGYKSPKAPKTGRDFFNYLVTNPEFSKLSKDKKDAIVERMQDAGYVDEGGKWLGLWDQPADTTSELIAAAQEATRAQPQEPPYQRIGVPLPDNFDQTLSVPPGVRDYLSNLSPGSPIRVGELQARWKQEAAGRTVRMSEVTEYLRRMQQETNRRAVRYVGEKWLRGPLAEWPIGWSQRGEEGSEGSTLPAFQPNLEPIQNPLVTPKASLEQSITKDFMEKMLRGLNTRIEFKHHITAAEFPELVESMIAYYGLSRSQAEAVVIGGFWNKNENLIMLSLDLGDQLLHAGVHEAFHALDSFGIFTPADNRLINSNFAATKPFYEKRYPGQKWESILTKEKRAFTVQRLMGEIEQPSTVAQKIRNWLGRLGNWLRGMGFQTNSDMLNAIASGEIAQRIINSKVWPGNLNGGINPIIKGFHGSGTTHNKFSVDYMLTGEGAIMMGPGLYFTDSYGIAKGYRDGDRTRKGVNQVTLSLNQGKLDRFEESLTNPDDRRKFSYVREEIEASIRNQPELFKDRNKTDIFKLVVKSLNDRVNITLKNSINSKKRDIEVSKQKIAELEEFLSRMDPKNYSSQIMFEDLATHNKRLRHQQDDLEIILEEYERDIETIEGLRKFESAFDWEQTELSGGVYHVTLNIEPHDMVDVDVPFNTLPKEIKNLIINEFNKPNPSILFAKNSQEDSYRLYYTGKTAANKLNLNTQKTLQEIIALGNKSRAKELRQWLLDNGIKAFRYRADGSRAGQRYENDPKYNYVVFDDNAIEIDRLEPFIKAKQAVEENVRYIERERPSFSLWREWGHSLSHLAEVYPALKPFQQLMDRGRGLFSEIVNTSYVEASKLMVFTPQQRGAIMRAWAEADRLQEDFVVVNGQIKIGNETISDPAMVEAMMANQTQFKRLHETAVNALVKNAFGIDPSDLATRKHIGWSRANAYKNQLMKERRKGYIPHIRVGNYYAVVKEGNKVLEYVTFDKKGPFAAIDPERRVLEYLKQKYPTKHITTDRRTIDQERRELLQDASVVEQFIQLMVDRNNKNLNDQAQAQIDEMLKKLRDQKEKAFANVFRKRRLDTPGWLLPWNQDTYFEDALPRYFNGAAKAIVRLNTNTPLNNLINGYTDPTTKLKVKGLQQINPEMARFARERYDYAMSPATPWAASAKSIAFHWQLGFALDSAAVNLLQTVTSTVPYLSMFTNPVTVSMQVGKNMVGSVYKSFVNSVSKGFVDYQQLVNEIKKTNPELASHILYLAESGLLSPIYGDEIRRQMDLSRYGYSKGAENTINKTLELSSTFFSYIEQHNRITAAMAAYDVLQNPKAMEKFNAYHEKKGWTVDPKQYQDPMLRAMAETIARTQFTGAEYDKPKFTTYHPILQVMTQFMPVMVKMTENYWKNVVDVKDPQVRVAAGRMLLMQTIAVVAVAGMLGLPLIPLMAMLYDLARSMATGIGHDFTVDLRDFFNMHTNPTFTQAMMKGLPATKFFTNYPAIGDLSTRADLNIIRPQQLMNFDLTDALGPAGSSVLNPLMNIGTAYKEGRGDWWNLGAAVLPRALGNVMRAYGYSEEGIRTKPGTPLVGPDQVTPNTIWMRGFGITSGQESEARSIYQRGHFFNTRNKVARERATEEITMLFFKSMREQDAERAKQLNDRAIYLMQMYADRDRSEEDPSMRLLIRPETIRQRIKEMMLAGTPQGVQQRLNRPLRGETFERYFQ